MSDDEAERSQEKINAQTEYDEARASGDAARIDGATRRLAAAEAGVEADAQVFHREFRRLNPQLYRRAERPVTSARRPVAAVRPRERRSTRRVRATRAGPDDDPPPGSPPGLAWAGSRAARVAGWCMIVVGVLLMAAGAPR